MTRQAAKKFCEITGIPNYLVRAIASEFRMIFIRLYAFLPFQNYKIKSISSANKQINIIFGCGCTSYSEWVGIDCFFSKSVDFVLDLRRKLPFKNESVDLCYSEHFIEHLDDQQCVPFIRNCFNSLVKGGICRMATFDLDILIDICRSDNKEWDIDYCIKELGITHLIKTRGQLLNASFNKWEHKYAYNKEDLSNVFKESGFKNIKYCQIGESIHPSLRNLETRINSTLIIEGTK